MYGVSERFLREVQGSHRSVSWVEILGEENPIIEGVIGASVTLDTAALVMGSFSLTIEDPLGTYVDTNNPGDLLSKFGSEVRPWRGVMYRDGEVEAVPLGTFRVEVNDPTETGYGYQLAVSGRDRSSIVSRPAPRPIAVPKGTFVDEAIAILVSAMYPAAKFDLLATPYRTGVILVETGGDAWAEAVNLAAEAGLTLHTDRWGRFVTREALSPTEQAVWAFLDGEGSTLTSVPAVKTSTGEPIPNGYVVMSSNTGTDSAMVRGEAWDLDPASPTYRYGRYGEVAKVIQSDKVTTNEQCTAAANLMMRQSVGAANEIDFSSVPNPALDPWDIVWVRRPQVFVDGAFYLSSLQIPLSAAEPMGGVLRKHLTMDELAIDTLIQDFLAPLPQAPETPGARMAARGGGGGGGGTTDPADPPTPTDTTGQPTKPGDDYTKPHPHTWPPKGDGTKPHPNDWKPGGWTGEKPAPTGWAPPGRGGKTT